MHASKSNTDGRSVETDQLGSALKSAPNARTALVLCLLLLAACARTPAPAALPETLQIAASTATLPLVEPLVAAYAQREPSVIVLVDGQNARRSLVHLAEGRATLAVVAGETHEAPGSASTVDDPWSAPLAVDAIAVLVHAANPLPSLTLAQLRAVYTGRTWHWSDLGIQVPGDEIAVVSREEGSGTRAAFEAAVLGSGTPGAAVTPAALVQWESAGVVTYVGQDRAAIGYVAGGHLSSQAQAGVKAVAIEDVAPSPENVASGAYRLALPFYLVAPKEPTGAARRFVDFCLSAEGQKIVARGYVPVR